MSDFDLHTRLLGVLTGPERAATDRAWLDACLVALQLDGASLLMQMDGGWQTVVRTDEVAARIDKAQLVTGEGPGVDALTTGVPVHVADWARSANRWPLFAGGLGANTLGALFALPLESQNAATSQNPAASILGVLHLYRRTPGTLDPRTLETVWYVAETVAATLLLD